MAAKVGDMDFGEVVEIIKEKIAEKIRGVQGSRAYYFLDAIENIEEDSAALKKASGIWDHLTKEQAELISSISIDFNLNSDEITISSHETDELGTPLVYGKLGSSTIEPEVQKEQEILDEEPTSTTEETNEVIEETNSDTVDLEEEEKTREEEV